MHRPAPAARSRRARRGTLVVAAATTLLVGGAVPASAQTAAPEVAGATAATALTLTVNLPGGEATKLILILDPVKGTVSRVTSSTQAFGSAEVISGSFGGQPLGSGPSVAMLPSPLSDSDNPTGAFADGLAGTPLENLLKIELLPSKASVSQAPTSASDAAVANVGIGLPDDIADALVPLTEPLEDALNDALIALAEAAGMTVTELCDAVLTDVVTDVADAIGPISQPISDATGLPLDSLLADTTLDALCNLGTTIEEINAALQGALDTLTGDSGVFGTGLITGKQTITSDASGVTSQASASIAGLTLLGQQALAGAEVLRTTSTAVAKGTPGSADATIDSTVASVTAGEVDPFLEVRATINGLVGNIGEGVLPPELQTSFDQLFDTLNDALAPVGIVLFKNDASPQAQPLGACPTELNGLQTGTFEAQDGTCAAAATRGVGLSVTLPEALASALMIGGPLVELQIVPSAAVARAQLAPVVVPPPVNPPPDLPRTGVDSTMLSGIGALLLLGAVALRRRRLLGSAA